MKTVRTLTSDPSITMDHSIRVEFRRLVNDGRISILAYNDFRAACLREFNAAKVADRIRRATV